jgi:hypothetical protein
MSSHTSLTFVGSFVLTLSLLIFGSRYVVETLNLFPSDPSSDLDSFQNILHRAWGSSKNSGSRPMSEIFKSTPLEGLEDKMMPIGFAVFLGLSAIAAFFVFGKSKSTCRHAYSTVVWCIFNVVKLLTCLQKSLS